jgi:hypothetical protein
MQQTEIQFFFPLVEQTKLDLDFTPCEQWITEWRNKQWSPVTLDGSYLITSGGTGVTSWIGATSSHQTEFVIRPSEKNVGKWEITDSMFVYRPTKPNAVIRFMAKYLLGFKWHDEI